MTSKLILSSILTVFIGFCSVSAQNKIVIVCMSFQKPMMYGGKSYIEKKDGTKIYGEKLTVWKMFARKEIVIDEQKIPLNEVNGYSKNGQYYLIRKKQSLLLVVDGKLSVYVDIVETPNPNIQQQQVCTYYVKRQGSDEFKEILTQNDLITELNDCKKALAFVNIETKEL
jgi:hypothetical protein